VKLKTVICLVIAFATFILAILLFPPAGSLLICMDSPLAELNSIFTCFLQQGFLAIWSPNYWMGPHGPVTLSPWPFLSLLPTPWVNPAGVTVAILIFSINVLLLTWHLKLHPVACIFAAVAALLTSHALTLTYAGHISKLMTYGFIPLACLGFLKWLEGRKWFDLVLAALGLALGMLAGEGPVTYFTGLWFTAWALTVLFLHRDPQTWVAEGFRLGTGLIIIVLLVALFAAPSILSSFSQVTDMKPISGGEDTAANWQFATQYFFPFEEIISFVTTMQFFGGPHAYWGRTGSPSPLRLSDDYMGLLPLGFAILGGITCWRIWQVRLFIIMAIVSLIISFGREGGLFWLLYQLPTMKSQRNPHRWVFFVALAACVLAGYGVHWLHQRLREASSRSPSPRWRLGQRILLAVVIAGALLFVSTLIMSQTAPSVAEFY